MSGKSPYAIFPDYRIPLVTAPSLSLKIHYPLLDAVPPVLKNCAEHYKADRRTNGVYTIKPDDQCPFDVYCDQENAGGGWTVFQKRLTGSVDFYRNWSDYKRGFGDLSGEFWLGLNKIHRLTNQTKSKLRVDLEDFDGKTAYAEYDTFVVAERRAEMYRLSVGGTLSETQALDPVSLFPGVKWLEHKEFQLYGFFCTGTAGDSLSYHDEMDFSTKDRDNDRSNANCASDLEGGWWYRDCKESDLNGPYRHPPFPTTDIPPHVRWNSWKSSSFYSMKRAKMSIRPVDFCVDCTTGAG